jgi:T5SS/PEP-CTERM-associated repeat protein
MAGSTGTVSVDGAGSRWATTNSLVVGNLGTGTLTITGGGKVQNGDGVIAFRAFSSANKGTGTVTVTGTNSQWINSGSLSVGFGQGTLHISEGALVQSASGKIGIFFDGTGVVNLSGAASRWINSGELRVGDSGPGTLSITSGQVQNANGIVGALGPGTATIDGGDSRWINLGDLTVGSSGTGTLDISAGGRVESVLGVIAREPGSKGRVTIDGANGVSSWINSGGVFVGGLGAATLEIRNGGQVQSDGGSIGVSQVLESVVTVNGANNGGFQSQWVMSGNLRVGRSGILNITNGARVENAEGTFGKLVNVSGPNSRWINLGDLKSDLANNELNITDGARVQCVNGAINGVANVSGAGSQWINSGQLEVGPDSGAKLNITGGGRVQSAGGSIAKASTSSPSTVTVDVGSEWINSGNLAVGIFGQGLLTIINGGRVQSAGASVGIGIPTAGGSVDLSGVGSTWTISGELTLHGGQVTVNPGASVFVSQATILGALGNFHLHGGTFSTSAVDFVFAPLSTFDWTAGTLHVGIYDGNLTIPDGGTLAPGNSAGTTRIEGSYVQQAGGTLEIEIGGLVGGTQFDVVNVTGNAALGGDLQLKLINGFVPSQTSTFAILQSTGNVTGAFANVANGQRLAMADGAGSFLVHYGSDSTFNSRQVILSNFLSAAGLLGDYNQNGFVDAADYVVWRNTFAENGTGLAADGNGNGTVDAGDYDVWRAHFGWTAGSGSAAEVNALVPEPACVMLLAICLLLNGIGRLTVQRERWDAIRPSGKLVAY